MVVYWEEKKVPIYCIFEIVKDMSENDSTWERTSSDMFNELSITIELHSSNFFLSAVVMGKIIGTIWDDIPCSMFFT